MGVRGLLTWIKKKYPQTIRKTGPTLDNYDMLFVDIPQYVVNIFHATAKPYSNSSILMCNILSDIDRLVQFSQPSKVIFFSIDSINGFLPYAKAILKRFRKIKISEEEAKRLAQQLNEKEGYVSTEKNEDQLLDIDDLEVGDADEFKEAFKEFSKLGDDKNQIDNSTIIKKVQEMVDKINQSRLEKAKKAKRERLSLGEDAEINLDSDEIPKLLTIDEFLNTVKRADYDNERVPDINEFLIEFQKEFENFIQNKLKSDPLYQNKKVIYSNRFDQGEAEHKIMAFLRDESQKPGWNPNTKICICSMDNDFINLSFQSYIRNITLLNYVNDDLTALLIDIKVLKELIGQELNATEQEVTKRLDDIVMITILISNDFTPTFPDLPSCSMEKLFELYKSIIKENPDFILFKDGNFNIDSVKFFLNTLIKKTIAPDQNTAKAYLMKFEEMFPNSPIEEMSKSIFETIAWTMYLYKYGIPSYSHYYKFEYAPPLSTAIQYVDSIQKPLKSFTNNFKYLTGSVLHVLSGGKTSKNIDKRLIEKIKAPDSPIAYMLEKDKNDSKEEEEKEEDKYPVKKIDIELTIKTIEQYEKELNIQTRLTDTDPAVVYFFESNKLKTETLRLNNNYQKRPFRVITKGVKDGILSPEFWKINDNLTFENANKMIGKMILYSRPYKIPATVKEVLKYDDVSEEERQIAFSQVSFEDPLQKVSKLNENEQKETNENEQKELNENEQKESNENEQKESNENENKTEELSEEQINQIKEKLIFYKVTPLSQYQFKENTIKDVIVFAPYALLVPKPNLIMLYVKKIKPNDFVITKNGYYGKVVSLEFAKKKATVDCYVPSQNIDQPIREIVSHDSENYLTEEEFAKQVGITTESVQLVASRLILMPDNSNIAIKFYSSRYCKLMCGFCLQNEDRQFLFSKEAVPIAKKYLNQPKIFKMLIQQSAAQTEIRIKNELEKESKNEEPEIKLEEVVGDEEGRETRNDTNETEQDSTNNNDNNTNNNANKNNRTNNNINNNTNNNNNNTNNSNNTNNNNNLNAQSNSYMQNQNQPRQQNQSYQNQHNRGGQSYRGRGGRGGRGGGFNHRNERQIKEKRKLYLNEPDTGDDTAFNDELDFTLPPDDDTENDAPFSIELPTSHRGTIITRLDNFFKHHKSVNASIFYPFESTSLSIESIHQIDQILAPITSKQIEKKTMTFAFDELTSMQEYELSSESKTFKAGDRVVLQKNRGYGVFGNYGTIICANDKKYRAVICLDRAIRPSDEITFTNYRMKNIFSKDCVVEFPYSVLKLVEPM